jgi:hypothetical protein
MAPVKPSLAISQSNILGLFHTVTAAPILQPPSSSSPSSVPPIMITFGVLAVFIGISSLTIGFLQLRNINARISSSVPTIVEGNGADPVVEVSDDVEVEAASDEGLEMRSVSR